MTISNMEYSKSFKDLKVWQSAHSFVLSVYRLSAHFPEDEKFGLISQFRRAAVSIAANIAEGYKKLSKHDKLRFYNIAQGSLEECRYYVVLSLDLNYINSEESDSLNNLIESTSRYLNTYCRAIDDNKIIS